MSDLFHGMTERQKLACALRLYDRLPLRLIALRIQNSTKPPTTASVCKMIQRGLKHLRRNGADIPLSA